MSWLSLSVPISFKFLKQDDEAEGEEEEHHETPASAVTESLSELTQIISRELWGAASFLAPPSSSKTLAGIRSDLAEIGNGFKTGLFRLSALLNSHPHEIGGDGTVAGVTRRLWSSQEMYLHDPSRGWIFRWRFLMILKCLMLKESMLQSLNA